MLAQGEFIKILFAESKDRTEIFRKIFETNIYEQISNNLSILATETKKDVERLLAKPELNMYDMRIRTRVANIFYQQMNKYKYLFY